MPVTSSPTTTTIGPITAQTELPDMKLPPMTPNPCNAQMTPAIVTTTPAAVSTPLRTVHLQDADQARRAVASAAASSTTPHDRERSARSSGSSSLPASRLVTFPDCSVMLPDTA